MSALLTVLLSFCLYSHITAEECSGNIIRMTNGRVSIDRDTYSMAGGLQICVNNRWATVCQSGWEDVDATVACEQLGLSYAGSRCQNSCYGNIRTDPAFYGFRCDGSEGMLQSCGYTPNRGCGGAAGVICELSRPSVYCPPGDTSSTAASQSAITDGDESDRTEVSNAVNSTPSTPTLSMCYENLVTKCSKCLGSDESAADLVEGPDNSMDTVMMCSNSSYRSIGIGMGIIAILVSVALMVTAGCLIVACLKLHKSSAKFNSSRCIDNKTYGKTEVLATNLQPSREVLPSMFAQPAVAMKTTSEQGQEGIEAFYDIITAEQIAQSNDYSVGRLINRSIGPPAGAEGMLSEAVHYNFNSAQKMYSNLS